MMQVVIQGLRSRLIVTQGYIPAIVVEHVRGLTARVVIGPMAARVLDDKLSAEAARNPISARVFDG